MESEDPLRPEVRWWLLGAQNGEECAAGDKLQGEEMARKQSWMPWQELSHGFQMSLVPGSGGDEVRCIPTFRVRLYNGYKHVIEWSTDRTRTS